MGVGTISFFIEGFGEIRPETRVLSVHGGDLRQYGTRQGNSRSRREHLAFLGLSRDGLVIRLVALADGRCLYQIGDQLVQCLIVQRLVGFIVTDGGHIQQGAA